MSENIFIIGVGMTKFGKFPNLSIKELTKMAVNAALHDAQAKISDIDVAYFANVLQGYMEGQHSIRGPIALRNMGFEEIPIVTVENACASASTAFNLAVQAVKSGDYEVALAVGAEKMYSEDKEKMFKAFDSAWDLDHVEETREKLIKLGEGLPIPPNTNAESGYSSFMDIYASWARFHMKEYGTTQEQIAKISVKNHKNSVFNPYAQYQKEFTLDEVLNARPITYPLTLPMCSPISDGAAAAIVCSEDVLKKFDAKRAVKVLSSVIQTGRKRAPEEIDRHISVLAAKKAYEKAGIGPEDISVAEVHDATAVGELIQIENLGFCEFGEGGSLVDSGELNIDGNIPVNPSGGLQSKGHPIGATGLAQIFELVTQLRGEAGKRQVNNPQFAIAENGGGIIEVEEAVCSITILGKQSSL